MKPSILRRFTKYASLNILGMLSLSGYILADTFFVAKALGATGLAALNLSISIYSIIHGLGLMTGIGGATRFSILMSQRDEDKANVVFATALKVGLIIGGFLTLIGLFGSSHLASVLGADRDTLPLTATYLQTILLFAPFFILNNIVLAFVRNDGNPNLAMIAMAGGSLSNVILDYVFMFPLGMGMFGAALATSLAPIISMVILLIHFTNKRDRIALRKNSLVWNLVPDILKLGLSAFIVEISSAVVLITFNLVILGLEGNMGVAAYGIVANLALVAMSIFTGLAQGAQPLVSQFHGMNRRQLAGRVLNYALVTAVLIATALQIGILAYTEEIIALFNGEGNLVIAQLAESGLRIYFLGFFFVGVNIVVSTFLSATEQARAAFVISIARGFVLLIPFVFILSKIWNMTGVWLAFVFTELVTASLAVYVKKQSQKQALTSNW